MSYRCPVHKYRRFRSNPGEKKLELYRCMNCSHYIIGKKLVLGRESLCWNCNRVFKLELRHLRLKPICDNCRKTKTKETPNSDLLKTLMEKLA